jgi:GNAT superfamily N-acetyltransferase
VDDLTMRPYQAEDADAVARLWNTIEAACGVGEGFSGPEIRDRMGVYPARWASHTRLYFTPDGFLAAAGLIEQPPDGGSKAYADGGVHPDWRGRGLGRSIIAWQLERLAELHRDVAPDLLWEAESGCLSNDESALRLLKAAGLVPVRYYFDMFAPAGSVDAPLPDGLRMAPYTEDRAHQLYDAHMEAFADYWGFQEREFDKWTPYTIGQELYRPDLSRLVFDGDEIVAYVLSYDAPEKKVYIGQVGTRRPWRRRGIAGAMLADVLTVAADRGYERVQLGADADSPTGAVAVYERVGFRSEATFVMHRIAV